MQCERGQRKEDALEESMAPAKAQEPKVLEALWGWRGVDEGIKGNKGDLCDDKLVSPDYIRVNIPTIYWMWFCTKLPSRNGYMGFLPNNCR